MLLLLLLLLKWLVIVMGQGLKLRRLGRCKVELIGGLDLGAFVRFLQRLLQILVNLLHCIRRRLLVVIRVYVAIVQGEFMTRNGIAQRQLLLNWICGINNSLGMCAGYKFHRRSYGVTAAQRGRLQARLNGLQRTMLLLDLRQLLLLLEVRLLVLLLLLLLWLQRAWLGNWGALETGLGLLLQQL